MKKMFKKIFYTFLITLFILSPVKVSAQENPAKSEIFPSDLENQGALHTLEDLNLSQVIVPFGPFFHQDYYAGLPIPPVQPRKTKKEWQALMSYLAEQIESEYNVTVYNMILTKEGTVVQLIVTTNYYSPYIEIRQDSSTKAIIIKASSDNRFMLFYSYNYKTFIGGDGLPHPIDPDPTSNSLGYYYFNFNNWYRSGSNNSFAHFKYPDPLELGNFFNIPYDDFENDNFLLASNTSLKFNDEFVARYVSPTGEVYDGGDEWNDDWGGAPIPPDPDILPPSNNWWDWLNPLYWIGRLWDTIMSPLWNLIKWGFESISEFVVTPILNALEFLFFPSEDTLTNAYDNTLGVLQEKFPIIESSFNILNSIAGFNVPETYPADYNPLPKITIEKYGIRNQEIVDLSWYRDYRPMIFDFITYTAWFFFVYKTFKTIPSWFN